MLGDHLGVKAPVLWVVSNEFERVLDDALAHCGSKSVYRLDPFDGLVVFARGRWLRVLVEIEGQEVICRELSLALMEVITRRGILVISNGHLVTDPSRNPNMADVLEGLYSRYRRGFTQDNDDEIPAQIILVSPQDTVPNELARFCHVIEFALPTPAELTVLTRHVATKTNMKLNDTDAQEMVRAGRGLAQAEFMNILARGLRENKFNAAFVSEAKTALLAERGLLEIRRPSVDLDSIGGLDNAKELIRATAWTWHHSDEAKAHGLEPMRRVLLIGISGSGKSFLCEATAKALGHDLAKTGVSNAMNKYVGQSEANMRAVFTQIKALAPITLWVDEFGRDMSGSASSGSVDGGTTDRVHGEFLTGIQELPEDVFFMAAANRIEDLPPEMLRADRFDKIMFVGMPTVVERMAIFRIHLGERHESFDLSQLAQQTPFFTGAEIKALIREVNFKTVASEHRPMTNADLVQHAPLMKGRIWLNHRSVVVSMYERAKAEWDWASSDQEREADRIINAGRATLASVGH